MTDSMTTNVDPFIKDESINTQIRRCISYSESVMEAAQSFVPRDRNSGARLVKMTCTDILKPRLENILHDCTGNESDIDLCENAIHQCDMAIENTERVINGSSSDSHKDGLYIAHGFHFAINVLKKLYKSRTGKEYVLRLDGNAHIEGPE